MEYRHEIINFGERVPVRCFIHQLGQSRRHWHESLELLFVLTGEVTIIVDGEKYLLSEDDVILVNTNAPHELSAEHCILAAVQIKLSLFDENLLPEKPLYFDCNSKTSTSSEGLLRVKRIVAQFVKIYADNDQSLLLQAIALSYALLSELVTYFRCDRSKKRQLQVCQQSERITRIVGFITEHYRENITLQQIAEREYLSIPYLSRFFNRMMGMSFSDYLQQLRLTQAVSDLISTNARIERIAEDNGYPNTQSFVEHFKKKYGMLPSRYRKLKAQEGPAAKQVYSNEYTVLESTQYLRYFSRYLEQSNGENFRERALPDVVAHFTADAAAPSIPLKHTWRALTSVGSAKELLQADVQRMLTELQREVEFSYVKFHGILSDDMHVCSRRSDGRIVYSFVYVDMTLDFLCSIGLKPLIELGFMPAAIAQHPEHRIFETAMINSPPIDIADWCALLRAFVKHLLARYGSDTVEQWPFTVWNEPDTPTSMFGFAEEEAFFQFYRASYETLRDVDSRLIIGAPATYYSQEQEGWLRRFTAYCRECDCMPAFIPFHFYGTVLSVDRNVYRDTDVCVARMQLTTDENMLSKSIDAMLSIVRELYGTGMPVWLTEWNLSPSHRELLGDTCFRSCYLVKNILENMDRLTSIGYWVLTDLIEEHQVAPELFHGGLGLFTYNGVRKSAYYALCLLRKLGKEMLGRGDGWFLTRSGRDYQLLLYNYRHYSDLYAACESFDISLSERYTPFGDKQRKEFEFRIEHLPKGDWNAMEYSLSRSSGSAFDKWVEMGAQPLKNEEELSLLRHLSHPMINQYTLHSSSGGLIVNAILDLLEVKLILLSPTTQAGTTEHWECTVSP